MTKFRSLLLLSFYSCLGLLSAQEGPSITGKFLVFPKTSDQTPISLIAGEGAFEEINPTSGRFTKPIKMIGMKEWVVGKPGVDAEGKPTFEVWGRCASSGAKHQSIILFRKGETNADGFSMLAFDDNESGFGKGKFLVFNVTNKDVGAQIGDKRFQIKPAGKAIVEAKGDIDKGLCSSTFAVKLDGEWKGIFSSNWPLSDNARALIFVYGDAKTKKYTVHAVRDFIN
ncbi:hypothetical protein ACFSSA_04730 [Luteolibacter algae]|uniref:Uncharacterized protein n=1 Tax=Luteolibacter algae TaxID=454151 RepID=A0ABW5D7I7_9BACT